MAKPKPNLIANLNFRTATRPVKAASKQPRDVVLDFIDQQIALATAELDGRELTIEKSRYLKDDEGRSVKSRVATTPRRYFWHSDGEWLVEIRYGNIIVELSAGHPSIAAGTSLTDVVAAFNVIKAGVEVGEADEAIAVAAGKARRKKAA